LSAQDVTSGQTTNGTPADTLTQQNNSTTTTTNNNNTTPPTQTTSTNPDAVVTKPAPFTCAIGALTCFEVASMSNVDQSVAIVTLGQAFKKGDLTSTQSLVAKDGLGTVIPMQMDAVASRVDGSVRMAVLSARLTNLAAGEKRVISLFKVAKAMQSSIKPVATNYEFDIEANVYRSQMSQVTFGNRNGQAAGVPFLEGETVTLQLSGPATESYVVPITATLAGGSWTALSKVAAAFKAKIDANARSAYRAIREGEQGGYENLWLTTKSGNAGAFNVNIAYSGLAQTKVTHITEFAPAVAYKASAGNALRQAIATNGEGHLRGAVANEYTLSLPFLDKDGAEHPHLRARLHVRVLDTLAGGHVRTRTDMAIENNWIYKPNPGNLYYDLTVKDKVRGETLLTQSWLKHNHHARWHKVIWQGGEVLARVRHNMSYLLKSGVLWHYNENLTIPESTLKAEATKLAATYVGPMAKVFLNPIFGTTGGRPEIGPYPRWTALYLLSQDDRALNSMLANADAAGSVPIHYRDENTNQPINLEDHPGVALRYGNSEAAYALPTMIDALTEWAPDNAHQGSFSFVPYLITGDVYYLEEMMFWTAWNMGGMDPGPRGREKGIIQYDQIRGQSWSMRSLGEAARVVPDAHPMRTYFVNRLQDNLSWYASRYNKDSTDVSPMGMMDNPFGPGATAPWQNDFMVIVLSQLVQDGVPEAKPFFDWLSAFTVGRFKHQADAGYCLAKAPSMSLNIKDANKQFITTWRQLAEANWPGVSCDASLVVDPYSYPATVVGYAAYARAMLAATYNAGKTEALASYYTWMTMTPLQTDAAFGADPTWAIVPAVANP
jgi:hypothetical protein